MIEMKQIPSFPNYSVTKDGRVWSKKRPRVKGGWVYLCKDKDGYFEVQIYNESGKQKHKRVHRLVLETYVGPCPQGMECRHLNGNPPDNRLENLCWGTAKENHKDSERHGTAFCGKRNSGEKNYRTKLTEQQVHLIFNAYHDGAYTQQELADYFNVGRSTIGCIATKKRWIHIW